MSDLWKRQVLGDPECPLMHRWRLLRIRGCKLVLHHFIREDLDDPHDHQWTFVTLILKGGYWDMVPGPSGGLVISEVMRPGMVRLRHARHVHRVKVMPGGCWTLVFTFPKRREWGFIRMGRWINWREHERLYGSRMRCDEEDRLDRVL